MKRLWTTVLSIIGACLCLSLGFWFGVREGVDYGLLIDTPASGVLATYALTGLDKGETRAARLLFDGRIDRGLLSAHDLLDSPTTSIIGSISGKSTDGWLVEDSAIKLAKYRKINPSPIHGEYLTHDPGETPEQSASIDYLAERNREAARTIAAMVEQYASK